MSDPYQHEGDAFCNAWLAEAKQFLSQRRLQTQANRVAALDLESQTYNAIRFPSHLFLDRTRSRMVSTFCRHDRLLELLLTLNQFGEFRDCELTVDVLRAYPEIRSENIQRGVLAPTQLENALDSFARQASDLELIRLLQKSGAVAVHDDAIRANIPRLFPMRSHIGRLHGPTYDYLHRSWKRAKSEQLPYPTWVDHWLDYSAVVASEELETVRTGLHSATIEHETNKTLFTRQSVANQLFGQLLQARREVGEPKLVAYSRGVKLLEEAGNSSDSCLSPAATFWFIQRLADHSGNDDLDHRLLATLNDATKELPGELLEPAWNQVREFLMSRIGAVESSKDGNSTASVAATVAASNSIAAEQRESAARLGKLRSRWDEITRDDYLFQAVQDLDYAVMHELNHGSRPLALQMVFESLMHPKSLGHRGYMQVSEGQADLLAPEPQLQRITAKLSPELVAAKVAQYWLTGTERAAFTGMLPLVCDSQRCIAPIAVRYFDNEAKQTRFQLLVMNHFLKAAVAQASEDHGEYATAAVAAFAWSILTSERQPDDALSTAADVSVPNFPASGDPAWDDPQIVHAAFSLRRIIFHPLVDEMTRAELVAPMLYAASMINQASARVLTDECIRFADSSTPFALAVSDFLDASATGSFSAVSPVGLLADQVFCNIPLYTELREGSPKLLKHVANELETSATNAAADLCQILENRLPLTSVEAARQTRRHWQAHCSAFTQIDARMADQHLLTAAVTSSQATFAGLARQAGYFYDLRDRRSWSLLPSGVPMGIANLMEVLDSDYPPDQLQKMLEELADDYDRMLIGMAIVAVLREHPQKALDYARQAAEPRAKSESANDAQLTTSTAGELPAAQRALGEVVALYAWLAVKIPEHLPEISAELQNLRPQMVDPPLGLQLLFDQIQFLAAMKQMQEKASPNRSNAADEQRLTQARKRLEEAESALVRTYELSRYSANCGDTAPGFLLGRMAVAAAKHGRVDGAVKFGVLASNLLIRHTYFDFARTLDETAEKHLTAPALLKFRLALLLQRIALKEQGLSSLVFVPTEPPTDGSCHPIPEPGPTRFPRSTPFSWLQPIFSSVPPAQIIVECNKTVTALLAQTQKSPNQELQLLTLKRIEWIAEQVQTSSGTDLAIRRIPGFQSVANDLDFATLIALMESASTRDAAAGWLRGNVRKLLPAESSKPSQSQLATERIGALMTQLTSLSDVESAPTWTKHIHWSNESTTEPTFAVSNENPSVLGSWRVV
ncbi:MAG: hypothetical protein AAGG44_11595, partial [Planctomycetota bacterium]